MIELRRSLPSEVTKAVPLIYSSGPPSFEYVFKTDQVTAKDFLNYAFVKRGGEFSYDNHYSFYQEGEMIGIGSAFNAKTAKAFTVTDALNIIKFYKWRSPTVLKHGLQVEQLIQLPKNDEVSLAHIAITPSHQGKGHGTALMKALIKKALGAGQHRLVLDVSEENPRAEALYQRMGFSVTKTYTSKLKNKHSYVATHHRMELVP